MKKLSLYIKQVGVYVLSMLVPRGKMILFHSAPPYTDNPYALFRYIVREHAFPGYRMVWALPAGTGADIGARIRMDEPEAVVVHYEERLRWWWYVLRARWLVYSHLLCNEYVFCQKDKRICLWHGTGIKPMGVLNGEVPAKADRILCTSDTFVDVYMRMVLLRREQIWPIGNPRTDCMWEETDFFEKHHICREDYQSVGIWMPTFRKHRLEVRQDGDFGEDRLCGFTFGQLAELDAFLCGQNKLLIVKLHMFDSLCDVELPEFSHLLIVKPQDLHCQLYPLLGACDYLISDYSSVSTDYDILGRPMAFVLNDQVEYQTKRGFLFPDIEHFLPGRILHDMEELKEFVACPERYRIETGQRLNTYKDNHVCRRVVESIKKELC